MARTIDEIQDQILATQATYLPDLTSTSKVSVFRLIAFIIAVCIHYVETLFDAHKKEVQDLLDNRQPATRAWYAERVRVFQLGDDIDGTGTYPVVNTTKQIISRLAVKETLQGEVLIKVAKGTVGQEEALAGSEKLQLESYIDKIKYAGTKTEVVSLNADLLNIEAEVFYDPIYTLSDIQARTEAALYTFMTTLKFDGIVRRNELIRQLRNVAGVNDIEFTTLEGQTGTTAKTIVLEYEMTSGYIKENVVDYPFATSITYTPEAI